MANESTDWDVLVVGRSYAGLSAALTLARARRSVLVVGEGGPRNESVSHVHGFLTRDGASPSELIAAAEDDVGRYPTAAFETARVGDLDRVDGGFRAHLGDRPVTASFVVLATGVNDSPAPVPGLAEHWGRGVFTCPFCDGFEHADLPLAILGDQIASHHAAMIRNWSADLTIFTQRPSTDLVEMLRSIGDPRTRVEERPVRRVVGTDGRVSAVELIDGTVQRVAAIFVPPCYTPNSSLAASVGASLDEQGFVVVDPFGETSVGGVFAVGDVVHPMQHQISIAVTDGVMAGSAITRHIVMGS